MRIAEVTPMVMGTAWRNLTIVRVRTDEGLEGVGEVRMVNHTQALLGYLAHAIPTHVLGADPFEIEALVQRMWRTDFERAGATVMSGIAAIEIACWDIVGKALGQPVHRLLGGAVRPRIKAYANGWYTVERTPEEFHAAARRVVERGYRALKLDPFGAGSFELEPDERRRAIALVEAVRAAIGPDAELLVEMHGRFTPATAIAIARDLEPFAPSWIEEPVPPENLAALEKVARRVSIPVATGERIHVRHEFRELLERQAADVMGGPISTAAALHLAACTPNFKIQEHFNDFAEAHVKLAAPGNPEVVDGHFAVPAGPGLGVTLDEDVVRAHPMRELHFDLFADDWHFRQASPSGAER
jgi:galactonate dehydratase